MSHRFRPSLFLRFLALWGFAGALLAAPIAVEIVPTAEGYQLLRDGQPYYIKGAGAEGYLAELAAAGANSIRTWGAEDTARFLDIAHSHGLTVTAGIWIDHERHGFDYNDPAVFEAALATHRAAVDRFKDHPALLMWGIGNEVALESTNDKVWELIGAVAAYIKEVDPHHPIMTAFAHVSQAEVDAVKKYAPAISVLGFNAYAGIDVVAADARRFGWDGPYVITEWGPNGGWEVGQTAWGAELEPTTTEKALQRGLRYTRILEDRRCLGSYAFLWGQKQEVTPTWYGMFLKDGSPLEGAEVMQYLWSASLPSTLAPRITPLRLGGLRGAESITVAPEAELEAAFDLLYPTVAEVELRWQLLRERPSKSHGGEPEDEPASVALTTLASDGTRLRFEAPAEPGPYRLYVSIHNLEGGRAAAANIPFRVRE